MRASPTVVAVLPGQSQQLATALRDTTARFATDAGRALTILSDEDATRPYGADPRNLVAAEVGGRHEAAVESMRQLAARIGEHIEGLAQLTTTTPAQLTTQDDAAAGDLAHPIEGGRPWETSTSSQ